LETEIPQGSKPLLLYHIGISIKVLGRSSLALLVVVGAVFLSAIVSSAMFHKLPWF
jgi:hypothetical protein